MSSSTTATTSLYQALSLEKREIRLVTVGFREPSKEKIECRLEIFALEDAPPFKALSYVWGDVGQTLPITVNSTEVHVTTNLFAALESLQRKPRGTYFWIDALCINQSSPDEKNHQVLLMRKIYRQAEQVFMWLGKEENDSNLAMSMIEEWGKISGKIQLVVRIGDYALILPKAWILAAHSPKINELNQSTTLCHYNTS